MKAFAARKTNSSRVESRRGIVLVFVLWSIMLLSSLVMATSVSFRGFAGLVAIDRDKAKMDGLLTAGLEAAAANLLHRQQNDYRMPGEIRLHFPTGEVRAWFSDEQGRIDINKADVPVLTALFGSVGMPNARRVAQALVKWRTRNSPKVDQDDQKPQTANAQPQPAGQQKPADVTMPVQSFDDVRQLAQVPDFDAGFIPALAPLTTVFGGAKINPLTAPQEVLAVLPGVNMARVERLVALRDMQSLEKKQVDDILGPGADQTDIAANSAIRVELAVELSDGYAARATAVIKASPTDVLPYRVLAWSQQAIFQR